MRGNTICRHNSAESANLAGANQQGQSFTTTISNGTTTSPTIDIRQWGQGGFIMPAAFTGATVSYLVSDRIGGNFVALAGTTTTVSASNAYAFPAAVMAFNYVQIKSASSEGADRVITLSFKH